MKRPCSWCEGEFKKDLAGLNTGKSHGMCYRHLVDTYKQMGKQPPPQKEGGSFDLSKLSPEERSLLAHLNSVVKRRQQAKGVWN